MKLGEKQELFAELLPSLLDFIKFDTHMKARLKELYRPQEMADIYAKRGSGIKNSLHCKGLAIDLILFQDGKPLWDSADYEEVGEFWESLDSLCRWGGRFNDGCHFSLEHEGVK